MPEEKFKLPRSSYEELVKIIRTYGTIAEPVNLELVSKQVGMSPSVISANSAFLTQIEVLEPGKKKQASEKGRRLAKALDFEMPDEMRSSWRQVVLESDFLSRILAAIRIRKGMDTSSLVSHIAYSAGEEKKAPVLTGARAVVDILRAAELVKEVDNKFVLTPSADENSSSNTDEGQPYSLALVEHPSRTAEGIHRLTIPVEGDMPSRSQLSISITVNVTCTVEELEGLGTRLRRVIDEIKANADASEIAD